MCYDCVWYDEGIHDINFMVYVQQEEAMREDKKRREAKKEEERQQELEEERIREIKEVHILPLS